MRRRSKVIFAIGCSLVLAGIWPTLVVVNRIYPFVLGLPFLVFYMLMLNIAVAIFLLVALRKTE